MLKLRALVLVALGIPVMTALLVGAVALTVRLWGTTHLDTAYWIGVAVNCTLSLVALALVLGVRRRVVVSGEGGAGGLLARVSPILMLIGAIGGAVLAHFIAESAIETHRHVIERECELYVGEGQPIDACLPLMERCDAEVHGTDGIRVDRRGRMNVDWPEGLAVPDDADTRARHLCVWKAQHGG